MTTAMSCSQKEGALATVKLQTAEAVYIEIWTKGYQQYWPITCTKMDATPAFLEMPRFFRI